VQPDDKILVAGATFVPSAPGLPTGTKGIALARYNPDGTLDTGFGSGSLGFVSADIGPGRNTDVVSLALQGANIIVGGATSDGNFVLMRYLSDGTLDSTFGDALTPGTATTSVGASGQTHAIALQSDGKIIAAGGTSGAFTDDSVLVRYTADGALDLPFGGANTGMVFTDTVPASHNFANAVVVQPDNKIVVAGHANVDFNFETSDFALMRYNADGTLDTTFGGGSGAVITSLGAFDNAFSVALQTDLKIVVSGNVSVSAITRFAVVRYNPDGSLDASFNAAAGGGIVTTVATGPSGVASGNAVAVQPDGNIVVAGYD